MEAELLKSQINYALYPQEVLAAINTNSNSVSIGIPREDDFQENRIPLTPNSVASLVSLGCRVTIEADAGTAANFYDEAYINAGGLLS